MFSFFYPLMWLALPLVGVPLWLHLQRRRDPRAVRFSAMQFLDDQPLARSRPLRPRDLPLLLLRLLLIVLIIAAFAWPYVSVEEEALVRESRVYILDNTLSNQAAGQFEAEREEVAEALESAGRETQVAVVQLAREPEVVVRFGDDPNAAARRVRDLPPTHQRGSYAAAFRLAQTLLEQSLGARRTIILQGDSQRNQWEEDAAIAPFLERVEVELPPVEEKPLANVALHQPVVQRLPAGEQSVVQCAVRVTWTGNAGKPSLTVLANGREVLRESLPLEAGPVEADPADPLAAAGGQQTLLLELPDPGRRWLHGEIRVDAERDALAGDNRAFFSLAPVQLGRVALLTDSVYLKTAFSRDVLSGRWSAQFLSAGQVADHQPADVLLVESGFLVEPQVGDLVRRYLDSGRGVALLLEDDGPAVRGLLRDWKVELLPEEPREAAPFRYVFLEHPIFQPFQAVDSGDLGEVLLKRHRRLRAEGVTALAFAAEGEPVVLDVTAERGRLLLLAFRLDREETNWPLHPTFLPFLDGCLRHLRRPEEQWITDFEPGETGVFRLPDDPLRESEQPRQMVLRRYGEASEPLRIPVDDGQVRFAMPDQPGSYDLQWEGERAGADGERTPEIVLNVNPPPEESQLIFASASETLEGWRRETADQPPRSADEVALGDLSRREILRQNAWWWLLLAAGLALCAETAWLSRKRALPSTPEST